jgi:hypothetical protein
MKEATSVKLRARAYEHSLTGWEVIPRAGKRSYARVISYG